MAQILLLQPVNASIRQTPAGSTGLADKLCNTHFMRMQGDRLCVKLRRPGPAENVTHRVGDDGREIAPQGAKAQIDVADGLFEPVDLRLDAVDASFQRCQIVAILPGLGEDVAREHFLAVGLMLDRADTGFKSGEFVSCHFGLAHG